LLPTIMCSYSLSFFKSIKQWGSAPFLLGILNK
jgi:hypothetical protein